MSSSLRHVLISIFIVLLAVLAHGRLLEAGWLGSDLVLVRESTGQSMFREKPTPWMWEGTVRPAPTLVMRSIASTLPGEPLEAQSRAVALRVTAFVVLLLGALTAGFAIRRALLPWVGGDTARAAGFACALFIAVHPLAGAAIARPRSLGMLLVWLFGALAAFLFLRGRQMREKGWIVGAGIAAVLAGFCAPSAWLVPFVLAALELGSARRPRPMSERMRTALTTFAVFTACVFVESAVAAADVFHYQTAFALEFRTPFTRSLPDLSAWSSPGAALTATVEKLGLLFFPITGGSLATNWPSYLVCIAIVFIALWPVLRSARAAPRLWGSLTLAWILAMLLALSTLADVHVAPDDGSRADTLMIAAAFAAAGLAVAATSLLGTRRIVLPALIAIGLSWLAARGASNYVTATDAVAELRANITAAQGAVEDGGRVLVVEPPTRVMGLNLGLDHSLEILSGGEPKRRAQAIAAEAIPFLTRTAEFAEWRAHKVAFLEKAAHETVPSRIRVVAPTVGTKPPPAWREESRSPVILDLDPATVRFARVTPLPNTSKADAPRMAWRANDTAGERVAMTGVWLEDENGAFALFDPWRDPAWWTASTIRRVSAEDPLVKVALFELLPDMPLQVGKPEFVMTSDHDEWVFPVAQGTLPRPLRGRAVFVLEVYDPNTGSFEQAQCDEAAAGDTLTLRARIVNVRFTGSDLAAPLEWALERRVGDVVIARASSAGGR